VTEDSGVHVVQTIDDDHMATRLTQ